MRAWRRPTRRSFLAMLGAGVAALVVRGRVGASEAAVALAEPARAESDDPAVPTRWIGHC